MSDVNSLSEVDDFKNLQKRLNHEAIRQQFRSKLVGGLNEDDVTAYIEDIEEKLRKLEQENKKASDDIYSLKNRLNKELEDKYDLQENLHKTQNDLDTYIAECRNKELTIQSLNEDYSVMKVRIDGLEKENLKVAQLNDEIHQMSEERKTHDELLAKSVIEIEQVKKYAAEFEENNNVMKLRIADLEKENLKIAQLNNEIHQMSEERKTHDELLAKSVIEIEQVNKYAAEMSEERKTLEELLNESSMEVEQLKKCTAEFEENNNVMKLRIADLEKENLKVSQLNNEILQMSEERKTHEELLAKSVIEIERLKKCATESEEERKTLEELFNESSMEIEQVKKYAAEFEEDNSAMKTKIADLEKEIVSKNTRNDEINKVCRNLEQQIEAEKSCNEKQSKDLAMFSQKIKGLEEAISEKLMEINEQRRKNEKVELELNMEKARVLSYKINGFKDEFVNVYKQIENLSSEANQYSKNNNELQQQLLNEKLRADKAEKDFTELSSVFTSLKEKYYNEFNPYDNQFKQIVEKRNQLQPEKINEWLVKLK